MQVKHDVELVQVAHISIHLVQIVEVVNVDAPKVPWMHLHPVVSGIENSPAHVMQVVSFKQVLHESGQTWQVPDIRYSCDLQLL
jgi:hypothetical protein